MKLFSKKIFVELNMDVPGVDPLSMNGKKLECLKLFIAKRVEKFISNSIAITKNFKLSYPEMANTETIFYGININRFKKLDSLKDKYLLRDKLRLSKKSKVAVTCGQISRRKGVEWYKHQSPGFWVLMLEERNFVESKISWLSGKYLKYVGKYTINRV